MGLYNWIQDNFIETPVQLAFHIDKVAGAQCDVRYMKAMIEGYDVTQMVANKTGLKVSNAKDTYGDLIVHGTGEDMCFYITDRLYHHACQDGHYNMFNRSDYQYVDDVEVYKKSFEKKNNEKAQILNQIRSLDLKGWKCEEYNEAVENEDYVPAMIFFNNKEDYNEKRFFIAKYDGTVLDGDIPVGELGDFWNTLEEYAKLVGQIKMLSDTSEKEIEEDDREL